MGLLHRRQMALFGTMTTQLLLQLPLLPQVAQIRRDLNPQKMHPGVFGTQY
jgi:hypothetical protein